jgi:site-specific recombinase XerC
MKINSFMETLSTQTTSKETLRAYRQELIRFETFQNEKGLDDTQVKQSTITEYLRHREDGKGRTATGALAPATVARILSVVTAYFDFLQGDSDVAVRNPVDGVRRPKVRNQKPRDVDDSILAKLVNGIADVRDRAIVLLFVYSGLRLSELGQLDKTTIILKGKKQPDGSVQYFGFGEVIGKGKKRRSFVVGPKAMQAVRTYIAQQRMKDELPALFLSSRKTRLSSRAIQQIVSKWCTRLKLSHVHVHQLRHSFATRNVNAGMSAAVLQELMGHASLNTTQRYFHLKPERLSREYFAVMEYVKKFSPV